MQCRIAKQPRQKNQEVRLAISLKFVRVLNSLLNTLVAKLEWSKTFRVSSLKRFGDLSIPQTFHDVRLLASTSVTKTSQSVAACQRRAAAMGSEGTIEVHWQAARKTTTRETCGNWFESIVVELNNSKTSPLKMTDRQTDRTKPGGRKQADIQTLCRHWAYRSMRLLFFDLIVSINSYLHVYAYFRSSEWCDVTVQTRCRTSFNFYDIFKLLLHTKHLSCQVIGHQCTTKM